MDRGHLLVFALLFSGFTCESGEGTAGRQSSDLIDPMHEVEKQIQNCADMAIRCCVGLKTVDGAWGSGVIIAESGLILSSSHLFSLDEGSSVEVFCHDGGSYPAKLIRVDRESDVALVKFDSFSPPSTSVAVWESTSINSFPVSGSAFIAAGHASGYSSSYPAAPVRVGFGFVRQNDPMVFTTCSMTAGDSGGPLFDVEGNLRAIHKTMDADGKFSTHVPLSVILKQWPELTEAN